MIEEKPLGGFRLSFVSFQFLLFFPIVGLIYFAIPHKFHWIWLLAASYYFLMSWNPYYAILLFLSTITTWLSGFLIGRSAEFPNLRHPARKKLWLILSLVFNLGILFVFKYLNFFCELSAALLHTFGVPAAQMHFDLLLPVGISFYTFQALGYSIDVYRGVIKPEKNFGRYALFVSFFPQLVAGPIARYKDMLSQFREVHSFDYERAKRGFLLMLWGYFQKMVVADRLKTLVDTVYNSPQSHYGPDVIVATIFFAFQLYCDFSGYSDIAIGAAEVMGFRLAKNFDAPYFSVSIKDFWRRWHITLGTWLRDYLYIPLGGNRCSKLRRYGNLMAVFLVCGLWHGASLSFLVWGAFHGLYQIIGLLTKSARQRLQNRMHIPQDAFWLKAMRIGCTFLLTDFAWIFFRAKGLSSALLLIRNLFRFSAWDGSLLNLGLPIPELCAALLGIAAVLAADFLNRRYDLSGLFLKQKPFSQWAICTAALFLIAVFGIYGPFNASGQFIYSQF